MATLPSDQYPGKPMPALKAAPVDCLQRCIAPRCAQYNAKVAFTARTRVS
jgi:hypothetical protein